MESSSQQSSSRARNARKVTGILALMFGVIPMTFLYYSVERNVRARRTLVRSCEIIRTARTRELPLSSLVALYGPADGERLNAALDRSLTAHCETLQDDLSWWMWNVMRWIELPVAGASREQLGELPEQILARCERREQSVGSVSCKQKEAILRGFLPVPSGGQPAWSWAGRVSAVAREVLTIEGGHVGRVSPH